MTQPQTRMNKVEELKAVFTTLDEVDQEYALALLQGLLFTQTKRCKDREEDVKSLK